MASAAGKPAYKIQCPPCGGGGLGPRARLRPLLDPRSLGGCCRVLLAEREENGREGTGWRR